jgi:hypothetical protein
MKRNHFRQLELDARRSAREQMQQEYRAGYRAGIKNEPIPEGASLSFRTGHEDGRAGAEEQQA